MWFSAQSQHFFGETTTFPSHMVQWRLLVPEFNRLPDWSSEHASQVWPMIVPHTPCRSNKTPSMRQNTCTWERGALSPSWERTIQVWSCPWSSSARWKNLLKIRPKKWRTEKRPLIISSESWDPAMPISRLSKNREQGIFSPFVYFELSLSPASKSPLRKLANFHCWTI